MDGNASPGQLFSIVGLSAMDGLTFNPAKIAVVESTPSSNCLRGVLLDGPTSTELFSSGPWLQGRLQGQTKTHKLVCRNPLRQSRNHR
jgi:hypothetical protein